MFTFIIPLKSAKLASNWDAFSKLFERTIQSVCNQNNDNYKVIVACHELPNISYKNDKVEYIQVSFDPPKLSNTDWEADRKIKEADKTGKILVAYEKAKTYNPSHIMVVDADDCITNSIVSFVEKQDKDKPGWFVARGYFYREGTNYLILNKKTFNNICGTSVIIRTDLLPQLIVKNQYYHEMRKLPTGIDLVPLPFTAALYSIANGENHVMSKSHAVKLAKKPRYSKANVFKNLYQKFYKYSFRLLTRSFKKKFNFYHI